jgi:hypothetical protein
MSRPINPRPAGAAFLAIGIALSAALAGQQAFPGVGIPFLVLGVVFLRKTGTPR